MRNSYTHKLFSTSKPNPFFIFSLFHLFMKQKILTFHRKKLKDVTKSKLST